MKVNGNQAIRSIADALSCFLVLAMMEQGPMLACVSHGVEDKQLQTALYPKSRYKFGQ